MVTWLKEKAMWRGATWDPKSSLLYQGGLKKSAKRFLTPKSNGKKVLTEDKGKSVEKRPRKSLGQKESGVKVQTSRSGESPICSKKSNQWVKRYLLQKTSWSPGIGAGGPKRRKKRTV